MIFNHCCISPNTHQEEILQAIYYWIYRQYRLPVLPVNIQYENYTQSTQSGQSQQLVGHIIPRTNNHSQLNNNNTTRSLPPPARRRIYPIYSTSPRRESTACSCGRVIVKMTLELGRGHCIFSKSIFFRKNKKYRQTSFIARTYNRIPTLRKNIKDEVVSGKQTPNMSIKKIVPCHKKKNTQNCP